MDNQEHHPHCVFMSNSYSQDHGKPEDDYDYDDDEEELKNGMGCFLLFLLIVIFLLFAMLIVAEHNKTEKSKQEKKWIEEIYTKLEQEEALKKAIADSMQHVQDSIEKYNYLCDSIAKAQYIQDSINYVLSLDKKVAVDLVAFIDDGITSREVKVNAIGDSITSEEISKLGKTFNHMAWTAAKERQIEIDNNQEYYTKRIINEEQ